MRQVIYDHIDGLGIKGFILTDNLPWSQDKEPLYMNNKKHIYVDVAQIVQSQAFDTLDLGGAVIETVTVSVYFVNDAKILPSGYDDCVEQIKTARLAQGTEGFTQKLCQVSSEFANDNLVTTFEFSFKKLITN
jgi:hypothetical protein